MKIMKVRYFIPVKGLNKYNDEVNDFLKGIIERGDSTKEEVLEGRRLDRNLTSLLIGNIAFICATTGLTLLAHKEYVQPYLDKLF